METNRFLNTLWTYIVLDEQMTILEVSNFDKRLFFGKHLIAGKTIQEIAEQHNHLQVENLTQRVKKVYNDKRNTYFVYRSNYIDNESVTVSVHAEYRNDRTVCLYLTIVDANDLSDVALQTNHSVLQMIENIPVGIEIYDSKGRLIDLNKQALADVGVSSKESVLGVNFFDHPNLSDEHKERLRKGENISLSIDYDFDRLNGFFDTPITGVHNLETSISVVKDAYGRIDKYIFASKDLTELVQQKKKYEEMLNRTRQKTEIAMKASDIMLWEFDVKTQLFYSENEPLNGYDSSQYITVKQYIEMIHPDDIDRANALMERLIAGENFSFHFDTQVFFDSISEWQYCSINGSPCEKDEAGHVIKYVGIRKNNTEDVKRKLLQDKILNNIPLPIYIKDVEEDFRYVFCNEESVNMFGLSIEKTANDIMKDECVQRIRKTDLEVFNSGNPYLGVEEIVLKDGTVFDTIVRKSIIEDDGKRLLLNIRWDQSMQNDLKRRSKLFDVTLETMDAYTWFYEPNKERINFGDSFTKVGRSASEMDTLDKFVSWVHEDDKQMFLDSLKTALAKDSSLWKLECRIDLNGDGIYTWWETHGIVETNVINDIPNKYLFGMTICIEPHKQTESILLQNKEELNQLIHQNELILNSTNSGLAYITTDYIVQWENISICSASLSHEAYKVGEYCYKSAHNRTSPCENCVLNRTLVSRQVEQITFTLDNDRMVEIFATPVLNADNEVDGIVIRVDDITERENIFKELKRAKALAEQSDKLKSAFLANMSHEIRTPLNAIVGFSELLASTEEEEEKEEYIRIISSNNDLLLRLINDILDLSKIEAGSVEFVYEEFDLSDYFNNMLTSMRQRVTNPNVRLVGVNPYEKCNVCLDKNRVAQIITNYVTNAIKYTPKGFIEMGYECTVAGVKLYVKDSGIGIPEDKLNKVFHRFAKLDEFAQGTGLGLSICKAIAESMHGNVGFETTFGEGSLFWVELPCDLDFNEGMNHDSNEPKLSEETSIKLKSLAERESSEINPARKTILVAEDIYSNYLLISTILKKQYNLLHAKNGKEAVEMVRNYKVDLVFMDMKMPIMDGLTATTEIRELYPELPIVALTAHAFENDRIAALNAGCNDYLVKPIDKVRLRAVLDKYC